MMDARPIIKKKLKSNQYDFLQKLHNISSDCFTCFPSDETFLSILCNTRSVDGVGLSKLNNAHRLIHITTQRYICTASFVEQ